jgi:hypothetical protein
MPIADAADRSLKAVPGTRSPVADLLGNYSVEVTPRSKSAIEACRNGMPRGSEIYIASIPGGSYHSAVTAAIGLMRAGFNPVPHVAARNIASFTQLNDFLARLVGDAGVTRALVIGGDNERPAGPYGSSLALLQTGAFQKNGVRKIGIACYAEPNRRVETPALETALADKLALLAREGLDPWLVSQFCFDGAAIRADSPPARGRHRGAAARRRRRSRRCAHAVEVCPALRHRQFDACAGNACRRDQQPAGAQHPGRDPRGSRAGPDRGTGTRHRGRSLLFVRRRRRGDALGQRADRRNRRTDLGPLDVVPP